MSETNPQRELPTKIHPVQDHIIEKRETTFTIFVPWWLVSFFLGVLIGAVYL